MADLGTVSGEKNFVKCTQAGCQGKPARIKKVVSHVIEDEGATGYAKARFVNWYCAHCNNPIHWNKPVRNLPDTMPDTPGKVTKA